MGTILIDKLLHTVVRRNASDLHITVGQPPTLRVHGRLKRLETKVLEPDDTTALMKSVTPERCQQELQEVGTTDFGFAFGELARFRVSVFKQRGNVAMVLRQIPVEMMTFEQLGTPPVLVDLIMRPRGLILVTGPTGSGKTTTLASAIDYLNDHIDHHIITIEDPIEFYHTHKKSIVNQREIGVDLPSFAEGIRRALRQDPDAILVGEMRDLETIEAAITAAETGHIVFGTLHTTGASGTINRIIDVFPQNQQAQIRTQLSVSLAAVICQDLLPTKGREGRVPSFEIMVGTPGIHAVIREGKTHMINTLIQAGAEEGMVLRDQYLSDMVREDLVTYENALVRSTSPTDFARRCGEYAVLPEDATAVGSFGALVTSQYLGNYDTLVCPDAGTTPAEDPLRPPYRAGFTRQALDYAYVAGLTEKADSDSPIALDDVVLGDCRHVPGLACGEGSNHGTAGVNELYVGGHVFFKDSTAGEGDPIGFLPELDAALQAPKGETWRVRWE